MRHWRSKPPGRRLAGGESTPKERFSGDEKAIVRRIAGGESTSKGRFSGDEKPLSRRLADWLDAGLDLLYPPALYCICCGNLIDESRTYHLCDHCIDHIHWDGSDVREVGGLKMLRCVQYGLYERTLIFSLKYNRKSYIAREIGQIMADRLSLGEVDFDVIVPVPMFAGKERQRGFNQAALMGIFLGRLVGTPCIEHALVRLEATRPMRGLSPTERQENVKGKFAFNEKYGKMLEGKRVLLIDDFYTTGSTARECHQALLAAGVADVVFLAFAAK